jgi:elongation factor Tu
MFKKARFERTKPHCNIGTIGHVDHGKTTLTAAITKCLSGIGNTVFKAYNEIDSHVEEMTRGITINAAHVEYETEKRHYSHIDCPGHQQYVKNMLTGAAQMDGAILVIAVNDGPQVQTREHIILAREVGIAYLIVYINKLDFMLDPTMKELVEMEARELLESYGFPQDLPVITGSARMALEEETPSTLGTESVKKLMDTVDNYIPQPDSRLLDLPFLLPIEHIHAVKGRGTVVTGKVEQGSIKVDDALDLVGPDVKSTVCMGLEMFRKSLDYAQCGDSVGVLLKGIKKKENKKEAEDVKRGYVICKPGFIKPYIKFTAKVYILSAKEGGRKSSFTSNYKPQFFFRTSNVTGTITLPEESPVAMPGEHITLTVELFERSALTQGLRFVMREGNLTVGAGVILDLLS